MILPSIFRLSNYFLPLLVIDNAVDTCRCLYGESCWPNENEFAKLASQLSKPVLHILPPASACYPPSAPSGSCADVIANFTDSKWRSDQPGAMQSTNFETFVSHRGHISACYLDTTLGIPCGQGSVPPAGVDARSERDVQAAVNFAKQHNLKLAVKGTGHDFLGRSTAHGSFLIWTHHMKQTVYNPSFVPDGAPATAENTFNAVTLGAGVQWHDAYDFVEKHGRFMVGGSATVGAAGGWVMGGGHGPFSPAFGLGVDNVLQFTVVLADGSHVATNSYQHPDLFWALRGGGGSTYGVVTSTTYKTYPIFSFTRATLTAKFTSPDIAQDVTSEFIKIHPTLSDAGWSASFALSNSSFSGSVQATNTGWADAISTFFSFVRYAEEATGGQVELAVTPYESFYEFYKALPDEATGSQVELASRLLPRSLAVTDPAKAAKILLSVSGVTLNSVAGGAVSRPHPDSAGLNPAWRNAISEVVIAAATSDSSATDFFLKIDYMKQSTLILDQLTTDSASYLNECSRYELDFKKSFFGSHYDQLKSIKDKYDPTSLFVVPFGVGSDEWDAEVVCGRRA